MAKAYNRSWIEVRMDQELDDYFKANRALWDEYTQIHARSKFYDLEGFKAGRNTLQSFEIEELSDVAGKSLLHLQCHFGMDTLSWARLGAKVTGVDFSEKAIELAEQLGQELDLDAQFVCANVYELPQVLQGKFDIVYTSGGVLIWLPDLARWAQVITHVLKKGGTFYMFEIHPFSQIFDGEAGLTKLHIRYPYFPPAEPLKFDVEGSYADREARINQKVDYEWVHTMSDMLNALIAAGLRIEFMHEFSFTIYAQIPDLMEQGSDGLWRLKEGGDSVPLLFSLKATLD
jgi:2-polyprenyl-3-methyl-5-hydroxy-6-metoxy-1,4-benzoquinol methylase